MLIRKISGEIISMMSSLLIFAVSASLPLDSSLEKEILCQRSVSLLWIMRSSLFSSERK